MADYYPTLARAVAALAHNDVQARKELYARARAIVTEQLSKHDVKESASQMRREQAALETAIRRVEAESQPAEMRTHGKAAAPPPRQPAAVTADRVQGKPSTAAKPSATSLMKILDAVQSDGARVTAGKTIATTSASTFPLETNTAAKAKTTDMLGGVPRSLGTMLLGITYIVAALAFSGVTYIRCLVWVYQGVIGYPVLLAVMAITLGLFIVPPVVMLRRTPTLPTVDVLSRLIYLASRRVL
ncbi:MAG: hypothetical protein WCA56_09655 [Xanthobacteraceae bacterium]